MISFWQRWLNREQGKSLESKVHTPFFDPWLVGWLLLGFICLVVGAGLTYQVWAEEQHVQVLPVEPVWKDHSPKVIEASSSAMLVVAVVGAVKNPGVYRVSAGSRVHDALLLAGGMSSSQINERIWECLRLARPVLDGETLLVPSGDNPCTQAEESKNVPVASENQSVAAEQRPQVLEFFNTASASELDGLPNVGEKRVEQLLDARPFLDLNAVREKISLSDSQWADLLSFDGF